MSDVVIGLHMIVRDEEAVIGRCLDSILPGVDRALIMDTGSSDGTILAVNDARVRADFPPGRSAVREMEWPGNFGEARQASLDALLELWPEVTHVVWCDADDVVVGAEHLREWAARLPAGSPGALAHYAYGFGPSGELTVSHYRERIVRREAIAGWVGAIHENLNVHPGPWTPLPVPPTSQLQDAWPRDQGGVEWIHDPAPNANRPQDRNRVILERELDDAREAGDVPVRLLGYLAQEYQVAAALNPDDADDWNERAAALYHEIEGYPPDEQTYQLLHRYADLQRNRGLLRAAQLLDELNVKHLPSWPDAWIGLAATHLAMGEHELALTYADVGLSKPYPQTGLILNPTDYSIEPRVIKAEAFRAVGRLDDAMREITLAQQVSPSDPRLQALRDTIARGVNQNRTRDAVLALDEALSRHDEPLNAIRVLESVPYFLRADPEIRTRLTRRRRSVAHLESTLRYRERYEGGGQDGRVAVQEGETYQDAVRRLGELPRAQFLLAGLREQFGDDLSEVQVLDVGCNDGWLGFWLCSEHGVGGYRGIDLSQAAIDAAYAALDEHYPDLRGQVIFDQGGAFSRPPVVPLHAFDAVVCFEVLEHVDDPRQLAWHLDRHTNHRGRVYLSTPDGAYDQGDLAGWDSPEPRNHVRAMRPAELTALALDHGEVEGFTTAGDRTMCVAYTPRKRVGTVDLYLGPAGQSWNPLDVNTKGLGGSETMVVRTASRLAEWGLRVRVYGAVEHEMAVQGVEYLPFWMHDPTVEVDALIVSRAPGYLREVGGAHPRTATFLWLHDAAYPDLDAAGDYDEVWCVGKWQARELFGDDWALRAKDRPPVRIVRNGIPAGDFPDDPGFEDRNPTAVYSSSPDRGLERLLDLWPRIVEECRDGYGVDPELVIAYGFSPTYEAAAQVNPDLHRLRRKVEDAAASDPTITLTGAIGQPELHELQRSSRAWTYPTSFPEVSCITAMESQAAGMAILTTAVAELPSTVLAPDQLFPHPDDWDGVESDDYVVLVGACLCDPDTWERWRTVPADVAASTYDSRGTAEEVFAALDAQVIWSRRRWDAVTTTPTREPEPS